MLAPFKVLSIFSLAVAAVIYVAHRGVLSRYDQPVIPVYSGNTPAETKDEIGNSTLGVRVIHVVLGTRRRTY
jgi:hypothetical protein